MTKPFLIAVAGVAASATFACAQAQTTANLTFRGQISPPACSILIDDATLDFGSRPFSSLNVREETVYTPRRTALNILCENPSRVGFSVRDNRPGSVRDDDYLADMSMPPLELARGNEFFSGFLTTFMTAAPNATANRNQFWGVLYETLFFGLGVAQPNSAPIGALAVIAPESGFTAQNAGARLASVSLIEGNGTPSARQSWGRSSSSAGGGGIFIRPAKSYTLRTGTSLDPVAFTSLTLPLVVRPSISPASRLPVVEEIALNGSVTFTLHYL